MVEMLLAVAAALGIWCLIALGLIAIFVLVRWLEER